MTALGRSVAGQLVGDHDARRPTLALKQFVQQPFGGNLVAPALRQDVEHDPLLVHRAPEPVPLAADAHRDLASRAEELHLRALLEPYVT